MNSLFFFRMLPFYFILLVFLTGITLTGQASDKMKYVESQDGTGTGNLLYLHFDKQHYNAGETIWFKAYSLNPVNNLPFDLKANLYLELYDFSGREIFFRTFILEKGIAWGNVYLNTDLPDGNYLIRAYTSSMLHYGEDFLFKKYLYIQNPDYGNSISKKEIQQNISFNDDLERKQSSINLEIHPEGGNLLSGTNNRLVLFLSDGLGKGIQDQGYIQDDQGKKIASFQTDEYGYDLISVNPGQLVKYSAVVEGMNGKKISRDLPVVISSGVNIHLNRISGDSLFLDILSTGNRGNGFTLTGNKGGSEIYRQKLVVTGDRQTMGVPLDKFTPGIVFFELLDDRAKSLSHRAVIIEHQNQPKITVMSQNTRIEQDEVINIYMNLSDINGLPLTGELSFSILAGDFQSASKDYDIYTQMFLMSGQSTDREILTKLGFSGSEESKKYLDMSLISGTYPVYSIHPAKRKQLKGDLYNDYGIKVRGMVKDPLNGQPTPNIQLQLSQRVGNKNTYDAVSDENGIFEFAQLELPDSALIDISTPVTIGGVRPKIELIVPEKKQLTYEQNFFTQRQALTEPGKNRKKSRQQDTSGKQTTGSVYGMPDQTIVVGDKVVYSSMLQLLQQRASGLMISGNSIMFRGPSSINFSNDPLFIVDQITVSKGEFLRIDPRTVERIELFKGTSAAFFGSRGANGVLVAYLKKSEELEKPFHEFVVEGFSSSDEFVFDIGQMPEKLGPGQSTTVWWQPSIHTSANGSLKLQFRKIPNIPHYKMVIQGISKNGGVFSGEFLIGK